MTTLDDAIADCQSATSDTSATTQTMLVKWLNRGYGSVLAQFGRAGIVKTMNTTTNVPSNPLAETDRSYGLPPDYTFIKTVRVQIGSRWYNLMEEESQEMWEYRTQYVWGGIPSVYFIQDNFGFVSNELQIDPICTATTSNGTQGVPLQIKYESMDINLDHIGVVPTAAYTFQTATPATLTFTYGTNTVTSNQAIFNNWMGLGGTYITAGDDGDGNWYKIINVNNSSNVTIGQYYQGTTTTSSQNWSVNQVMNLHPDMVDLPNYYALWKYYLYKKDAKWKDYYKQMFFTELQLAKGNWATKSRSSIIRSKQGVSRWHTYPGWFPASGVAQ